MFNCVYGSWEIARGVPRSASDIDVADRHSAQAWLRQFKGDCFIMAKMRAIAAETQPFMCFRSDEDVIEMLSWRLASHELLLKKCDWPPHSTKPDSTKPTSGLADSSPEPAAQLRMSGYFTMLKFVLRARSLEHLEKLVGYPPALLSSKGLLIYRFLRLPEINEFEVCGYSNTPKQKWDKEDRERREAELGKVAAYHRNFKVPSFDEIQRGEARKSMALSGDNTLVKLYPNASTEEVYPSGEGIAQWRLTEEVKQKGSILGQLLFRVDPGKTLPWVDSH